MCNISGFKVVNKYKTDQAKTTHMLTGAVSKQSIDDLREELSMIWYWIATDESSNEGDKHLPIFIWHNGKTAALIKISLLHITNMNSGSTVQQMFNACN